MGVRAGGQSQRASTQETTPSSTYRSRSGRDRRSDNKEGRKREAREGSKRQQMEGCGHRERATEREERGEPPLPISLSLSLFLPFICFQHRPSPDCDPLPLYRLSEHANSRSRPPFSWLRVWGQGSPLHPPPPPPYTFILFRAPCCREGRYRSSPIDPLLV